MTITDLQIRNFENHLKNTEKSDATLKKYLRDLQKFQCFIDCSEITKETIIRWKEYLIAQGYATRSINSMLASINSFLDFSGLANCRVKSMRIQRQIYCAEEKELSKEEYYRLLNASSNNRLLNLVLQTICSTGIRVSELKYFTVEAVQSKKVVINCKNKTRTILIPEKLRKLLLDYAKRNKRTEGMIFLNKKGKSLGRCSIWSEMKHLCQKANVNASKVFPHNLRKLFARTFYSVDKDIAKLADILGHSSIETTRIYIMTTGEEHRRKLDQLGLVIT